MTHYAGLQLGLQQRKDVFVNAHEVGGGRASRAKQLDWHYTLDSGRTCREYQDPVSEFDCFGKVVGHEKKGLLSFSVNLCNLFPEGFRRELIDSAKGLIHQNNLWVYGESSGYSDPLLHSTGQLFRIEFLAVFETHHSEKLSSRIFPLTFRYFLDLKAKSDVLQDSSPRKQSERLKDHADLGVGSGQQVPPEADFPRGRPI